jgi:hypothetical protein
MEEFDNKEILRKKIISSKIIKINKTIEIMEMGANQNKREK